MAKLKSNITNEQKVDLGNRLKKERQDHKLTAKQVADKVEVSGSHISQMESGKNLPSTEVLILLEDLFGIKNELFAILGEERPETGLEVPDDPSPYGSDLVQGKITAQEGFLTAAFANRIHTTKDYVDIMDTWIGDDLFRLENAVREALGRGVKFRIMLLRPELAKERGKELGYNQFQMVHGERIANANLQTLHSWYTNWPKLWEIYNEGRSRRMKPWDAIKDNLQVRILSWRPPVQYFRFDRTAYMGLYLHLSASRFGPQIQFELYERIFPDNPVDTRTILGRTLMDEFDYIWQYKTRGKDDLQIDDYDLNRGEIRPREQPLSSSQRDK